MTVRSSSYALNLSEYHIMLYDRPIKIQWRLNAATKVLRVNGDKSMIIVPYAIHAHLHQTSLKII